MAKNPQKTNAPTKKHLARQEREKQQIRWIIIGTIVILGLVIGLILAGIINENIIKPRRTVAVVNGDVIRGNDFQNQVRFSRAALIQNAQQTAQFMQLFQEDPNTMASFASQLQQIQYQLEPVAVGQEVIDRMVDDLLISQEAERRGITLSEEDINKEFQNILGYFPEGTPTPKPTLGISPTSTYSALQLTASAPTPTLEATGILTATATVEPTPTSIPEVTEPLTPTATLEPTLTPTPFTAEGYADLYKQVIDNYSQFGVSEKDLRYVVISQLLSAKLQEDVLDELDVPSTREETWAQHILVEDEQTAKDILSRLENGESWCQLAAEFSTDPGSKDSCGDLGWFAKGVMTASFEEAAFSLPVGEVSDPIQSEFGYHIIWVLGREEKQISESEFVQQQQTKFQEWIGTLRESSQITIDDYWKQIVPNDPELPIEILQLINLYTQSIAPETPLEDLTGASTPEP
jgi:parvulin-like peptidyl-prolyl isomerase